MVARYWEHSVLRRVRGVYHQEMGVPVQIQLLYLGLLEMEFLNMGVAWGTLRIHGKYKVSVSCIPFRDVLIHSGATFQTVAFRLLLPGSQDLRHTHTYPPMLLTV